ncbi:Glycosyltransferase involved in cell wall bisynthesis [Methanolobus vulcani]|uniref:Glycosyltransferase involved in cell wall bisynthesis n=1 Tax=Methanolobus vulcani TaxID=38026 RepID=A0A7Z7AWS5_9EURY|nr:glycosyltransferase family 4 protein [Methanolobus vulcani]SDF23899.1 Glycosyltransferase involved in cell wall bisynthesis [Methanolobus vulcani]
MKILRVAADLYPYVVGGVGLHVHEMSRIQSSLGHEVLVCTTDISKNETMRTNYSIKKYPVLAKILGNSIMPAMFFDLYKNRHEYDVIHAHSHLYFSTNLCVLLRLFGSSPFVITSHGLNSQTAPKWFQDFYTATGARITFKAADRVICYTDVEKQELIDVVGINPDKICVIHNGINTEQFIPIEKSASNANNLLWIGRYAKGKGVDYLIEALDILRSENPGIILTMVGRGPDKERFVQKIHELDLDGNVVFKDYIPNSEIVNLYNQSSIFVLPSLEEGVPRTILEAMSCGVPVVCSQLPQLVDIVEGSGFLVPVKDSNALANRISRLIADPELSRKLGEYGRKRVVRDFSWDDTVKRTISLYEELV